VLTTAAVAAAAVLALAVASQFPLTTGPVAAPPSSRPTPIPSGCAQPSPLDLARHATTPTLISSIASVTGDAAAKELRWNIRFLATTDAPAAASINIQAAVTSGASPLRVLGYDLIDPAQRSLREGDTVAVPACQAVTLAVRTSTPPFDGVGIYEVRIPRLTSPEGTAVSESLRVRLLCSNRDRTCSPAAAVARWTELRWSQPSLLHGVLAFHDLVAAPGGFLASAEVVESGQHAGAIFRSADAVQWQRVATLPSPPILATTPARQLAVINRGGASPAAEVWTSGDGASWQRDDRLSLATGTIVQLVARGDALLALGTDSSGRQILLRSPVAGAAWSAGQWPGATAIIRSVFAVADGYVALGRDGAPDQGSGGVGAPGVGRPAAWWSADGASWAVLPVEGAAAPSAQLLQMFTVGDGYLALGQDSVGGGSPRTPVFWTSSDGHTWRRLGPPEHWGMAGSNGQQAVVFAAAGFGTVSLGAWTTTDGVSWTPISFTGDLGHVPGYEVGLGSPSRVDRILVSERGIVVIGQLDGQPTAWFAEGVSR